MAGCSDAPTQANSTLTATPEPASNPPAAQEEAPTPTTSAIQEATFDDIKFDIEPDAPFDREMLTPEIEALFGRRIRIRGYMLPSFQQRGLKQFVLVRDNMECCFGPGAALYDCMVVNMQEGASADFSIRPIVVEGVFRFEEVIDPATGNHLAIYALEGEAVR